MLQHCKITIAEATQSKIYEFSCRIVSKRVFIYTRIMQLLQTLIPILEE